MAAATMHDEDTATTTTTTTTTATTTTATANRLSLCICSFDKLSTTTTLAEYTSAFAQLIDVDVSCITVSTVGGDGASYIIQLKELRRAHHTLLHHHDFLALPAEVTIYNMCYDFFPLLTSLHLKGARVLPTITSLSHSLESLELSEYISVDDMCNVLAVVATQCPKLVSLRLQRSGCLITREVGALNNALALLPNLKSLCLELNFDETSNTGLIIPPSVTHLMMPYLDVMIEIPQTVESVTLTTSYLWDENFDLQYVFLEGNLPRAAAMSFSPQWTAMPVIKRDFCRMFNIPYPLPDLPFNPRPIFGGLDDDHAYHVDDQGDEMQFGTAVELLRAHTVEQKLSLLDLQQNTGAMNAAAMNAVAMNAVAMNAVAMHVK